ncbi:GntR family transcriptional regulator [Mesorhizobium sp. BR1-1-16]|uniref:GntR family transcriptional regulator n=1 Tax=Mesorhizobium sp. BR1-1-16 TaxID=2876653 RepID=UPI001CCDC40B|nr:GntR family transcriptional regulator [Mesorhizobium sp. BR1-1-16]MBZ9938134.1 GntR family transcriptional regulator [Mesorhizobium sp. BR1-1-16]
MLTQTASPASASGEGLGGTSYRRVHKAILADIVNGVYSPGARLKVAELSKRYGLSPMPIREALQQLQGEGFVIMSPNRGASVRPIDRRFVADIYEVRSALYTIIYSDAIKGADAALDEALVAIQKRFDALVERGDIAACHEQNRLLHATIEALCRNREVANLIARYSNLTSSLRDVFGYNLDRLSQISEEHWMIIEAIRARDAGKAIAAAQHHVRRAFENMSQYIPEN